MSEELLHERYRMLQTIGDESGMGIVWHAEDVVLRRPVAIKTTKQPKYGKQLVTEAQNAARARHTYSVAIYDFGAWMWHDEYFPAMVMEFINGPSIAGLLTERGPMSVREAVNFTTEMLSALEWSHRLELVHGDIKPANVMVSPDGHTRLADFGLACRLVEADPQASYGGSWDEVVGTPTYAAPEQWAGHIVAASDIWQTGITLFEMLTATTPFALHPAETYPERLPVATPARLSEHFVDAPAIQEVIDTALAVDPTQRFSSPQQMLDALVDATTPKQGQRQQLPPTPAVVAEGRELRFPMRLTSRIYAKRRNQPEVTWDYLGLTKQSVVVPHQCELMLEITESDIDQLEQILFEIEEGDLAALVLESANGSVLQQVGKRRDVRSLSMYGAQLQSADLAHVSALIKLESVSTPYTNLDDAAMPHLGVLFRLRSLDLSGTRVTDEGLKHLRFNRELTRLCLADTTVTAVGVATLDLPKLAELDLRFVDIDEGFAQVIAQLPAVRRIQASSDQLDPLAVVELEAADIEVST